MASKKDLVWNLTPLYKSEKDPQIAKDRKLIKSKVMAFVKKYKNSDKYLKEPKALKKALDEYEKLQRLYGTYTKENYYYFLRTVTDTDNTELKALSNKLSDESTKLTNEIQFFAIRLSKIPPKLHTKFLKSKELAVYKYYLEHLFEVGKHVLSEEEEKVNNFLYKPAFGNWTDMTERFLAKSEREVRDEKNKKIKVTLSDLHGMLHSNNFKVVDGVGKAIDEICAQHIEVAENEMNSILEYKKVSDTMRNYDRPDSSRLLGDQIPEKVVDRLVDTVSKSFEISQDFYALKSKLLGKKKITYRERMMSVAESNKKLSFDQANKIVRETFAELDKDFLKVYEDMVSNGNFDVFPRKGKRGGAFCISQGPNFPIYIMLNYKDTEDDVRTIAHETGHALHSYYAQNAQNYLNHDYSTAVAEVASTFFEDFAFKKMIEKATDEEKFVMMINKLDSEVATIFRQIAFYMFEFEMHTMFREKGYLSHKELGELFKKHMSAYLGNSVEMHKGSENWWIFVPHFRYMFYVFSYVSGLLISKSLQALYWKDPKNLEKIKGFLKAGGSKSPKDIFADLGIDITKASFWKAGLNEVQDLLDETILLANKLGKI